MPTSELSNALNPFAVPQRPRTYPDHALLTPQPPQQQQPPLAYVPHRSELEYAISELPPPQPPPPPLPAPPRPTRLDVVQELLRASKDAEESERKRRAAWEQELEDKYQQRQAESNTRLTEMKQELSYLKAHVATLESLLRAQLPPRLASPLRVALQHSAPTPGEPSRLPHPSDASPVVPSGIRFHTPDAAPSTSATLSAEATPSPLLSDLQPVSRKRTMTLRTRDGDGSSDSEASRSDAGERPLKRVNKHDTRCYTIQTAVRKHTYRLMEVDPDGDLPPPHLEGFPMGDNEPVRFVWNRTLKKSEHNKRTMTRVVSDLIANRRLYKHVPDADFTPKTVQAAFEQAYTTFRTKFKMQTDAKEGPTLKAREEYKSMKARRLGRKKVKLGNRTEARKQNETLAHATFDPALQVECMSSEESCDDLPKFAPKDKTLLVRGMAWRSTRLLHFYRMLDEDDQLDKSLKPKRGAGRHDRNEGPPKDGLLMPPRGVGSWMISRRWLHDLRLSHPDLVDVVKNLQVDHEGFDWSQFDALGYESEDELDPEVLTLRSTRLSFATPSHSSAPTPPASTASYSLQDALAPR
ncbi:hypothetical protein FA95DRAFT_1482252 [Auriscalpium vulgare]|uniref:Uncharacterized protein n=1 Tax=Auriscalpium vulgare TaxID=40419 RepID=A0ACB8SAU8_9AGAM|nr:hypothetical protein FA95DRAFT_1482252 [Auriscalpium vulgare]